MPALVKPSHLYETSFMEAVEEYRHDTTDEPIRMRLICDTLDDYLHEHVENAVYPEDPMWVPSAHWWYVDGDRYIGTVSLRYSLNAKLRKIGGHIGYIVRPSERGRGHGTEMLSLAVARMQSWGYDALFLTCSPDNTASRRIIEKNGGVLSEIRPTEWGEKCYYWIHNT